MTHCRNIVNWSRFSGNDRDVVFDCVLFQLQGRTDSSYKSLMQYFLSFQRLFYLALQNKNHSPCCQPRRWRNQRAPAPVALLHQNDRKRSLIQVDVDWVSNGGVLFCFKRVFPRARASSRAWRMESLWSREVGWRYLIG